MNKLLNKIKDWRARREQLSLERWGQIREKGKARFVLHRTLKVTVYTYVALDVYGQIFGAGNVSNFKFLIVYAPAGLYAGFFTWSTAEVNYKNAMLNHRLQMPIDTRISTL